MIESAMQSNQAKPLPQGWQLLRLEELIEDAQPGFACGERVGSDGTIQLRMNNISSYGQIDLSSTLRVPATSEQVRKYQLQSGDVLFNNTNSVELVGKTALFCEEKETFLYSNHLTRLRPKKQILDPVFLTFWLQLCWYQHLFQQLCNRWIGQAAVQREKLLALKLPLPPLPEQKRIVNKIKELMEEAQRARTACEVQLEAVRALPSTYLREVFESEEAKKWEKRRLGEVCQVIMGQSPPGHTYNEQGNGLPFLQGKIDFGVLYPTRSTWCTEPQKIAEPNDILISVRAPVGPTNLCSEKCCIGRGLAAIRAGKNAESRFVLFYLRHIEKDILNIGQGSTFGAIKREHIEGIELPLPRLLTQNQVATELKKEMSQAENLRAAIEKQLDTIKALLQAILRKAFSGEL